jgi:hypothetical protein
MELYFNMRPELYEPYTKAMDVLQKAGVRDVGFYIAGVDGWEYPFWVMAKDRALDMRFRHIGLTDQSKALQTDLGPPEYIIAMMSTDAWPKRSQYDVVYADDNVRVVKAK